MPVKIVTTTTNSNEGLITVSDLEKMKDDFINEADIAPSNGRSTIVKKFSVSVMKDEITNLIKYYERTDDIHVITMNFALNPDPFFACNGLNYSNSLTVVIEAGKFKDIDNPTLGLTSHTNEGDFVVIPAYKSESSHGFFVTNPCCPSSHP